MLPKGTRVCLSCLLFAFLCCQLSDSFPFVAHPFPSHPCLFSPPYSPSLPNPDLYPPPPPNLSPLHYAPKDRLTSTSCPLSNQRGQPNRSFERCCHGGTFHHLGMISCSTCCRHVSIVKQQQATKLPLKQVLPYLLLALLQATQGGREWHPKPRLPFRIWAQAPQAASMPLMIWLMATTSSHTASEPFAASPGCLATCPLCPCCAMHHSSHLLK